MPTKNVLEYPTGGQIAENNQKGGHWVYDGKKFTSISNM